MTVEAGKTYVRRLRALSTSCDELALRLRLERTLSRASLHPAWLPPSAILCVRKLRGRDAAAQHAFGNRHGASAEWERAIAARLDTLARRAARPARETVAAGAEAVIFEDQSELLACLAVDWCGGVEATRWWWQSLFGVREVAAALLPAWLAAPEHVPAALGRLSNAGKLDAFARKLDARAARDIRQRVTHKFSLGALEDALEQSTQTASHSRLTHTHDGAQADGRDAQTSTRAPWERFVPQTRAADLGDEQSALVGMSLMLLAAPSVVRSYAFAEAVTRWRLGARSDANAEASSAPAVDTAARASDSADETQRGSRQEHGRGPNVEADARHRKTGDTLLSPHATADAAADDASTVELMESRGVETEDTTAFVKTRTTEDYAWSQTEPSTAAREAERAHETRMAAAPTLSAEDDERAPRTFVNPLEYEARIRTEFGGVFYLINVALFLNLYGDFTSPLARGIDLPVWDFLALVGVEFCGARVRRDPVWTLLRKLSGREEEAEPGAGFAPPDAWRVPPEWLTAFRERRAWKWMIKDGRLRVLHPRGFLILDVPSSADEREQVELLETEMAVYPSHLRGPLRRASFATVSEPAGTLEGWLGRLLPYLRARLARALGSGGARALRRLVFEHEARVDVTATRLDVTFELARLPLEVRLAGLDRDAGWVPAAGRYVAFHFE